MKFYILFKKYVSLNILYGLFIPYSITDNLSGNAYQLSTSSCNCYKASANAAPAVGRTQYPHRATNITHNSVNCARVLIATRHAEFLSAPIYYLG